MSDDRPKRMPLWQLGLLQAVVFGAGWGAFMYHMSWRDKGTSIGLLFCCRFWPVDCLAPRCPGSKRGGVATKTPLAVSEPQLSGEQGRRENHVGFR